MTRLRVAYLACETTLPGAVHRRVDAFEHDRTMTALTDAFAPHGDAVEAIAWDAPARWSAFDAVVIGTTWDYWDRPAQFLARLRDIESETQLFNGTAVVAWNSDKRYLRDLEERGILIPPTVFLDVADERAVMGAFDELSIGEGDLVIKRRIGAGAAGQHRLRRGAPIPPMPEPMLAQPFLSSIVGEGELSFVFIDGALSHALRKRAKVDDYRVQSAFGGRQEAITPDARDVASAQKVLRAMPVRPSSRAEVGAAPLYARVDMVRLDGGALALMELEVIEPYLYPIEGPSLGPMLRAALHRRM